LEALDRGTVALRPVYREPEDGASELIAEGYARQAVMALEAHGASQTWTERRFVVRSQRHAKAAEASRRARVVQAQAHVAALHQRGRGHKRFAEMKAWRQAATAMVQRHQVEDFLGLRDDPQSPSRLVRADRTREAGIKGERQATVAVRGDEDTLEGALGRLGWRV